MGKSEGTMEIVLKCIKCNEKVFKNKTTFNEHKKYSMAKLGEFGFWCDLCPKSFCSKVLLNHHIAKVHHRKRLYLCESCPKSFSNHSGLAYHHESVHSGITQTCPICINSFKSAKYVERHILTVHERINRFKC